MSGNKYSNSRYAFLGKELGVILVGAITGVGLVTNIA